AQNNSEGLGTTLKYPVAGFHTRGSPTCPQLSTLPLGSKCSWSCTIGDGNTGDHWPTSAAATATAAIPPAGAVGGLSSRQACDRRSTSATAPAIQASLVEWRRRCMNARGMG